MGNQISEPEKESVHDQCTTSLCANLQDCMISFFNDYLRIVEYLEIQDERYIKQVNEMNHQISLSMENQKYNTELFHSILNLRIFLLEILFLGGLISRKYVKYTICNYQDLSRCLEKNEEGLINSIISFFSPSQNEVQMANSKDVVKSSVFRESLTEQIFMKGFCQYGPKASIDDQNSITYPTIYQVENNLQINKSGMILKLTSEECKIIKIQIIQAQYNIEKMYSPSPNFNNFSLLQNLYNLNELKFSSELDYAQIESVIKIVRHFSSILKLQVFFKGLPNITQIKTLYGLTRLNQLTLGFNEVPQIELKNGQSLKEIFIKDDGIQKLRDCVESEKIILKFNLEGFEFSESSIQLISSFKQVFILVGSSFCQFSLSAFGKISKKEQITAAQILIDFLQNNIFLDANLKFIDEDYYQRIQVKNISLQDCFCQLVAKIIIEFNRKIVHASMQIFILTFIIPQQFKDLSADIFFDFYNN